MSIYGHVHGDMVIHQSLVFSPNVQKNQGIDARDTLYPHEMKVLTLDTCNTEDESVFDQN